MTPFAKHIWIFIIALTLFPAISMASPKEDAMTIVKTFANSLKGELQAAIKAGGLIEAIAVCSETAPAIASKLSRQSGGLVRRVSLQVRNPMDIPDAWELAVLTNFDRQVRQGSDPAKLAKGEVVQEGGRTYFRFMKAIPTGDICLTCHGTSIDPVVAKAIDERYPHDVAHGYTKGSVRGAFTVKLPIN